MGVAYGQPLSYPSHAKSGNSSFDETFTYYPYGGYVTQAPIRNHVPTQNGFMYPLNAPLKSYPFYTQPINPLLNAPAYPNHGPTGLFTDSTRYVNPSVRWVEDYPLPDGLKMPSNVISYDGKGDHDNYLHLLQGSNINYEDLKVNFWSRLSQQKKFTKMHLAVHNIKQREGESTRAFVTRYTDDTQQILGLHKEQRIYAFVHGLKTRSLVEFLSIDLLTTYKVLMEKTYTWIEEKELATNGALNDHRESFDRFKKGSSWENNKGKKNKDRFSPYRGLNHGLLSNLSKIPREILATKNVAKNFKKPHHMIESRRSRDMSKYSISMKTIGMTLISIDN
nr:hypothetical protein [Tanacetum cinerariifolium]